MASKQKRMYAEIAKTEAQEDGTIKVWGYASTGAEDSDKETVTADAMKAALPDYMKFGAVREMHDATKAAGTAIEANVGDDGKTWFGAHVVDPIAVTKVQTGVYKGFSIGGKVTERDTLNKSVIKGIKLVEVSLVDRPANPEAVITVMKADRTPEDDVEELAELLDAGTVTPAQLVALAKASKAAPADEVVEKYSDDQPRAENGQFGSGGGAMSSAQLKARIASATSPGGKKRTYVQSPAVRASLQQLKARLTSKSQGTDDLSKGMGSVSEMASILTSIGYLCSDAEWESQGEGDASPVPLKLREWLTAGADIFQEMAEEELSEMLDRIYAAVPAEQVVTAVKAEGADDLAKAGAKFSKATKDALSKIHGACKEASAHLDGLGYNEEDTEDTDKVAKSDTVGIVTPNMEEAIQKAISSAIAPLNEALDKARKDNTDLTAKVEQMSKMAAPGKALLKALSITKAEDVGPDATPAEQAPAEGTPARAEYEMRKVFKAGPRLA